jgi:predicted nuclease of predicted toxin-antitoxin system
MRFLLDNNLSYKLKKCFISAGHECEHVSNLAMQKSNDMDIWSFARSNNYIIVTHDNDFTDLLNRNMSAIQDVFGEDVGIIELEQN